jgi:uncharacterized protein YndB with AHSA1/START domain
MKNENDQPGQFPSPGEVRLVRTLPGPIERIWDYLTDPAKRARWFAGGPMEPRVGGKMELFFQHKNIAPGETPPEQFQKVHESGFTMPGTILRWEPPRVLSYTFDDSSDVTFELTPQGQEVLLVLTHRSRGDDLPFLTGYASGWHTHVALLIALLEETPPPPFWATHQRLKADYEKLKAATPFA